MKKYQSDYHKAQDGRCVACRVDLSTTKPNVDHDHATGKVRGILCWHCNLILGHARDSVLTLRALAEYLEKNL